MTVPIDVGGNDRGGPAGPCFDRALEPRRPLAVGVEEDEEVVLLVGKLVDLGGDNVHRAVAVDVEGGGGLPTRPDGQRVQLPGPSPAVQVLVPRHPGP